MEGPNLTPELTPQSPGTALIHMEISASAVRCGAPVGPPGGLNLGQMTASPREVTCPACKPRKYWEG
jgi:hypothetical protein